MSSSRRLDVMADEVIIENGKATRNFLTYLDWIRDAALTVELIVTIIISPSYALVNVAATYVVNVADGLVNCTSGTFTVTAYTAVGNLGRTFVVKNSGLGVITLDGDGAETIDGFASIILNPKDSFTLVSDGSNWIII